MTTSLLVFWGGQEKAEYRFRYPAVIEKSS